MFDLGKFVEFLKKRKHKRSSQTAIGEVLGVNQAYVSMIIQGKRPFKEEYIELLKKGYGNDIFNSYISYKKNNPSDEASRIPYPNVKMIPLVSQYAQAGYLCGFADEEYMETLPTIPFIVDHEPHGNYIAFEVKGDSMYNGGVESIEEGDFLMYREINIDNWKDKKFIKKWNNFVIVHKTEGVLVKRIIEHNVEAGLIKIHSLNPMYTDREMNLSEIAQLFSVVKIMRSGDK